MNKRSKFDLSHYKLLTCDQGQLVPAGLTEVLPGDSFQHSMNALVRTNPLLAPVMHPVHMRIHHWFVPHRLVWDEWEQFITGGPDGMNASVFPTITFPQNGPEIGSLADYLGIPTDNPSVGGTEVSALPFRGYALIWNNWYRDQDLQTELVIDKTSGPDTTTSTALQNVSWEKDYFTLARPWTQKGPEITLPLGELAPVIRTPGLPATTYTKWYIPDGTNMPTSTTVQTGPNGGAMDQLVTAGVGYQLNIDPNGTLSADLADSDAPDINLLRRAFALQRYEEARAQYGSRYTEYLRYLGVKSSDARLQRPEYLGGGKQTLQFSEVLQTSPTTDGDDEVGVGNLKGHGIGSIKSNRYQRFFEEHGYVFTFVSTKPKTMYVQGLSRTWNRRTKEDFWQRELQHIGQQEILNKELDVTHASPNGTFGYGDRYNEYKEEISTIAGEFRTNLAFWHMARIFSSPPTLNADFVKANPTDRIYSTSADNELYIMCNHRLKARRIVSASNAGYIY